MRDEEQNSFSFSCTSSLDDGSKGAKASSIKITSQDLTRDASPLPGLGTSIFQKDEPHELGFAPLSTGEAPIPILDTKES